MIKLMSDSTCDLSQEIIDKYNISIVPLSIMVDGKSYRDRIDITPNEFYKILQEFEEHPTTSMPSPDEYIKEFNRSIEKGYNKLLCICMSSGTSGSYQSAIIAKDYYYRENPDSEVEIYVVDSCSMSLGSGWLIMKLAQLLEEGFTYEELIEFSEEYKENIKHFLCVDDLDNLIKSGRLNNASAFLGKLLKIKPIMTMQDKRGIIVANERGRRRVINYYIKEFMDRVDKEHTNFINIGYTDNISLAEGLRERIYSETGFLGEVYIMQKGAAVGTHVGSGGLSMFYMENGRVNNQKIRERLRLKKEELKNSLLKKDI